MRLFLVKILLFTMVTFALCSTISAVIWTKCGGYLYEKMEDQGLIEKYRLFKRNSKNYEGLIFGTSKTYRHIDPSIIDSKNNFCSYNLAFNNLFPFRLLQFTERVINEENSHLKYCLIELAPLADLGINYSSSPIISSTDINHVFIAANHFANKNGFVASVLPASNYFKASLFKHGGFGLVSFISFPVIPQMDDIQQKHLVNFEGFLSLDQEFELKTKSYQFLLNRKLELITQLKTDKDFLKPIVPDEINYDKYATDPYLLHWLQFANKIREKGVRIIFFIPPTVGRDYERIQSFEHFLKLNQFAVLDYSNILIYSELFEEKNYFDKSHLNDEGARILSKLIANDIFEILNNK